ncbi:DoxX family protein [Rhodococcus sp. NPDC055112]
MEILTIVCTVLLAVAALGAGVPKVMLRGPAWTALRRRGLSAARVRFIGAAELAGAAGLMVGLYWWPVGIAAAIGLLVLFGSAVAFHIGYGDFGNPDSGNDAWTAFALANLSVVVIAALIVTN